MVGISLAAGLDNRHFDLVQLSSVRLGLFVCAIHVTRDVDKRTKTEGKQVHIIIAKCNSLLRSSCKSNPNFFLSGSWLISGIELCSEKGLTPRICIWREAY